MKHIYAIATLFLPLFVGASCEDDYRDIVLFEGVEPIYQIGTCDNLISSVTLYLTNPDGIVLGIDGGDGSYSLDGGDAAVATVAFSDDMNGYRRIKVQPVGEGVANIVVKDGSGSLRALKVTVKDCYKFHILVEQIGYLSMGDLEESRWNQIQVDLTAAMTMKCQGSYTLIPNDQENPWMGGGKLLVRESALVSGFMEGTYEFAEASEAGSVYHFRYNDEVHDFAFKPLGLSNTRMEYIAPVTMFEDVTSLVKAPLPEGCTVYRMERWAYYRDDLMTNQ
ncbi:MAG: hypothetical protein LUE99_07160 [Bacteroides sp.]|nr:hypothetical protein [Bacteroides sp.]